MKTIQLNLIPSLIIEAVKGETFLKGKVDKAADEKAVSLAYNEQAGDDVYHNRKLQRGLTDGLEKLKTYLSDVLETSGGNTIADNSISSTLDNDYDTLVIELCVTDRFNLGYTDSLARLSARFITNAMILDWYQVFNPQLAQAYAQRVDGDKLDILRCFNKVTPKVPTYQYTSSITPKVNGEVVDALSLVQGGSVLVEYELSTHAVDDVDAKAGDNGLIVVERKPNGFLVTAKFTGSTSLTLYSRHNDTINSVLNVTISNNA